MIGIIAAIAIAALFALLILTILVGGHMKSIDPVRPECATAAATAGSHPAHSMVAQEKLDVEAVERDVFAKVDLIQSLVNGTMPMNGSTSKPKVKPGEPVDPEHHPPDETGYLKAITDKVEQIKRLSNKQNIG